MDQEKKQKLTAGVILTGNELLSGQTQDKNLAYIANRLAEKGISVMECRIIKDDLSVIANTVRAFSKAFDFVFTTGGIGPTHDDITAQAIAIAFDRPFVVHEEAKKVLLGKYGFENLNEARLRMARMPDQAVLIKNDVSQAPGFRIENVFVMAGIPSIMHSMMDQILPILPTAPVTHKAVVFCDIVESAMAAGLQDLQEQYPQVEIGSYPNWQEDKPQGVRVTARSEDLDLLEEVAQQIEDVCRLAGGMPQRIVSKQGQH